MSTFAQFMPERRLSMQEPEIRDSELYDFYRVTLQDVIIHFGEDIDAELFKDWWHEIGCKLYVKWNKKNDANGASCKFKGEL